MKPRFVTLLQPGCLIALLLAARPAQADLTVIGRYTFVNGDTATRASYFTTRRIRVSTPDGREVVFDSRTRRITLVDHARRLWWNGPLARADSIVDVVDGTRWDFMLKQAGDSLRKEWSQAMQFPADSIQVTQSFKTRMIAGYPCNEWAVHAGPYLDLQRWVAFSLAVEHYDVETEDLVLAEVLDPVARAIMSMFWESQEAPGLCLAAEMTFHTPTQQGSFRWEAVQVIGARIPESAWDVPAGYQPIRLASEVLQDAR